MVLDRQAFRVVGLVVGIIFTMVALLAAPVLAQDASEDQYATGPDDECPGAEVVLTETGTGDQESVPFTITGDRFRVNLTSEPTGSAGEDDVIVFVDVINNDNDELVTEISQDTAGTESSFVNAGPGEFFLDITSGNAAYTITVEDCVDEDENGDGVVDDSVPDKDLPKTGGPPLLAILFSVVAGAGLLTAVVRRRY